MKYFIHIFFLSLIIVIFYGWFTNGTLSSGDWLYRYLQYENFIQPLAWDIQFGDRLGGNDTFLIALNTYYINSAYLLHYLFSFPWEITERILWYFPYIIVSFFSSRYLYKKSFPKQPDVFSYIASLIYSANTYILMIVGGGQIAMGISYAFIPLIISQFLSIVDILKDDVTLKKKLLFASILGGLLFSLQVLFDLRIAYITLVALLFVFAFHIIATTKKVRLIVFFFVIPLTITGLLHAFWLLSLIAVGRNPIEQLGASYSSVDALKFFSFAKIEDTIGLLHPYWPENIFGKVSFMKPEYLIYPLLAFSSIFFVSIKMLEGKVKNIVILFLVLGLTGIFLAKGINDPFGIVYVWLFEHIPGFNMFRDPLKWYSLIALSYSIVIPYSLYIIYTLIKENKLLLSFQLDKVYLIIIISLLLFLIRQSFLGQLSGTFKPQSVPPEYIKLADFLSEQKGFFRTFWVPAPSNYTYSSYLHPRVSASVFVDIYDLKKLVEQLPKQRRSLQEAGVKYVIIPYAAREELFINDRKYDNALYKYTIDSVREIPWLEEKKGFGKIIIFELKDHKDHFWADNNETEIKPTFVNQTYYKIKITTAEKNTRLIFNEAYDPGWYLSFNDEHIIKSEKYKQYNSFLLESEGTYDVTIRYAPQRYITVGIFISSITFIVIVFFLLYLKLKR